MAVFFALSVFYGLLLFLLVYIIVSFLKLGYTDDLRPARKNISQ